MLAPQMVEPAAVPVAAIADLKTPHLMSVRWQVVLAVPVRATVVLLSRAASVVLTR